MPDGEVRAVLQIVHGMVEHIERYDEFAAFLAERGVMVVGHSHLGHGRSAKIAGDLGYFAEPDGNACVIGDIHELRRMTQEEHPGVPYFVLGHSMGSFLTRQYLGIHADDLAGAVIMGTADMPPAVPKSAKAVCAVIAKAKGWRHRSDFVHGMVTGGFHKQMGMGWLSKNEADWEVRKQDPFCNFNFTLNAYYSMFHGLERTNSREHAGLVPKNIPILFCAGAEDPVGGSGKGVEAVYQRYLRHGAKVSLKLYGGDRHEILHEYDRQSVFEDLYQFIRKEIE